MQVQEETIHFFITASWGPVLHACANAYIHTVTPAHTKTCMHILKHMQRDRETCMHATLHKNMCTHRCACVHRYTCAQRQICMQALIHTCTCVPTYAHTCSHTRWVVVVFLQSVSNISCSLLKILPFSQWLFLPFPLFVSGLSLLSYTDGSSGPIT